VREKNVGEEWIIGEWGERQALVMMIVSAEVVQRNAVQSNLK
jgi:hypothetical protein